MVASNQTGTPAETSRVERQMDRPCFIVVDRDYPGSISTRKLVIESAKLNVITAYDAEEALVSLRRFPNVDGVVLNAAISDGGQCRALIDRLRQIVAGINVVITSAGGAADCDQHGRHSREHHVDSLDPRKLLDCLQSLRREATAEILKRDQQIPDQ
ncbi:response regulator [Terriglobus albidus]|uniref:response regulator n=1 Tax=Terriglobus albidus TaxID=1592106 RepID=UPI0021DFC573|nr:response regulator [Terriglobus albidus]